MRNYSNTSVQTTLTGAIDDNDTSCTVADATGYPDVPFAAVLDPGSATAEEVVLVTAKAGTTWTVTRGYDGTTGKAHSSGATVIHAAIAADFTDLQDADQTLQDNIDAEAIARASAIAASQPLDATLTALAAYNTNGLIAQTAADTFAGRTITGTSNRLTVTNGDGVSGNPTLDISASYVGQSSITTLGTIGTGTWQGTLIGPTYGGTGVNNGSNLLTVPATGTAALLATANAFTAAQSIAGATFALDVKRTNGVSNAMAEVMKIRATPSDNSGFAQNGMGVGLSWYGPSDTNADRLMSTIYTQWSAAADASRTSRMIFYLVNGASADEKMRLTGAGTLLLGKTSGLSGTGDLDIAGNAQIDKNGRFHTTSGTTGYGIRFWDGTDDFGSFQSLDLTSTSYLFFTTNRYYDGTAWQQMNTRVGGVLQIAGDVLSYSTFPTSSSTPTSQFSAASTGLANARVGFTVGGTQVLTSRQTGWSAPSGSLLRGTFNSGTATAAQVAQTLAALITDLRTHGLINT